MSASLSEIPSPLLKANHLLYGFYPFTFQEGGWVGGVGGGGVLGRKIANSSISGGVEYNGE